LSFVRRKTARGGLDLQERTHGQDATPSVSSRQRRGFTTAHSPFIRRGSSRLREVGHPLWLYGAITSESLYVQDESRDRRAQIQREYNVPFRRARQPKVSAL
jgi:hypothetical protein